MVGFAVHFGKEKLRMEDARKECNDMAMKLFEPKDEYQQGLLAEEALSRGMASIWLGLILKQLEPDKYIAVNSYENFTTVSFFFL